MIRIPAATTTHTRTHACRECKLSVGRHLLVARQNVEQGTLASARWSHDGGELSRPEPPTDALQNGLCICNKAQPKLVFVQISLIRTKNSCFSSSRSTGLTSLSFKCRHLSVEPKTIKEALLQWSADKPESMPMPIGKQNSQNLTIKRHSRSLAPIGEFFRVPRPHRFGLLNKKPLGCGIPVIQGSGQQLQRPLIRNLVTMDKKQCRSEAFVSVTLAK